MYPNLDNYKDVLLGLYKQLDINNCCEIGIGWNAFSIDYILTNYKKEDLKGKLVLCVVNFPARKIGSFVSEVLTLGVSDETGNCVLIQPERDVPLGSKLY